ncbi:MAG: hypothetical protein ACLRR1_08120 [Alistipes shahii]|uniref:DUF7738 domain-containing protein n=1 Tax=Alistipes shahii TaxID=328814 RepID=UPI0039908A5E
MDSGYTKEQLEAMGVNTEHLFVFTEERATYNGKVFSIDILIDSLIGVFGPCERIVYGEEYNKGYDHYLWDEIGFVALVSPEKKGDGGESALGLPAQSGGVRLQRF